MMPPPRSEPRSIRRQDARHRGRRRGRKSGPDLTPERAVTFTPRTTNARPTWLASHALNMNTDVSYFRDNSPSDRYWGGWRVVTTSRRTGRHALGERRGRDRRVEIYHHP